MVDILDWLCVKQTRGRQGRGSFEDWRLYVGWSQEIRPKMYGGYRLWKAMYCMSLLIFLTEFIWQNIASKGIGRVERQKYSPYAAYAQIAMFRYHR